MQRRGSDKTDQNVMVPLGFERRLNTKSITLESSQNTEHVATSLKAIQAMSKDILQPRSIVSTCAAEVQSAEDIVDCASCQRYTQTSNSL